jgi:hypothetical protein
MVKNGLFPYWGYTKVLHTADHYSIFYKGTYNGSLQADNFAANPPSERNDELVVASQKDDLGSCSKATTPAPAPLYGLTAQDDDGGRSTAVVRNLAGKDRKALQQESFRRRRRRP